METVQVQFDIGQGCQDFERKPSYDGRLVKRLSLTFFQSSVYQKKSFGEGLATSWEGTIGLIKSE